MTSFVGRHGELSEIRRLLTSSRLVTITGMGGVGKTRLALHAASELGGRFHDGAWVAEFSSASRAGAIPPIVADVLGLSHDAAGRRADVLAQQLADRHLLLIFDTCEHLVSACGALAEKLLQVAPHVYVIATSRQPLGISGEHVLVIEPLNPPGPEADADPFVLRRNDSVRLFAERASVIVPGFTVNRHNSAAVSALCRRLDGVPLALELAAVRLRALSIEQLALQLEAGRRLGVGRRGGIARHRTMRAAVAWSYDLCTPAERHAWARLSVLHGDFGLAAAQAVCASPGTPAAAKLGLVESLVDKSVLRAHDRGTEVRYRMLGVVREYGRECLSGLGEETRLRRLHGGWCLGLARHAEREWLTGAQVDAFRRTDAEHASFQAALQFCFATPGERQAGLDLAATLWFYWAGCGHLGEGRHWLDRGIFGTPAAGRPGPGPHEVPGHVAPSAGRDRVWARALWASGYISILQGDLGAAVSMLEACKRHTTATGDERLLAKAVHGLGAAALIGGDHARATALFTDALARYEALGVRDSIVFMARAGLAMAGVLRGDVDTAAAICVHVQRACEAAGEQWARAYAGYVMALAAWLRRDEESALAHAHACLRAGVTVHDLIAVALALELIALLHAPSDPGNAAVLLGAASHLWPGTGAPSFWSPHFIGQHGGSLRDMRRALTERGFAAAFGYGARLPLDRAAACALGRASIPASVRSAAPPPGSAARAGTGASARASGPKHGAGHTPMPAGQTGSGQGSPGGRPGPGQAGLPGPAPAPARGKRPSPWPPLSNRECQVAELVAAGLHNREIAQRLVIAKRTADAHLEHIMAKLSFTSREQIAAWVTQRRSRGDGEAPAAGKGRPSPAQDPARPVMRRVSPPP